MGPLTKKLERLSRQGASRLIQMGEALSSSKPDLTEAVAQKIREILDFGYEEEENNSIQPATTAGAECINAVLDALTRDDDPSAKVCEGLSRLRESTRLAIDPHTERLKVRKDIVSVLALASKEDQEGIQTLLEELAGDLREQIDIQEAGGCLPIQYFFDEVEASSFLEDKTDYERKQLKNLQQLLVMHRADLSPPEGVSTIAHLHQVFSQADKPERFVWPNIEEKYGLHGYSRTFEGVLVGALRKCGYLGAYNWTWTDKMMRLIDGDSLRRMPATKDS